MTRPIPKLAVDFVSRFEGYRSRAYLCSAGVATLGFGHTANVKMGDTCTKREALIWLADDMQVAVRKLYGVLKPDIIDALADEQWAALVSFAFNLGAGKSWKIWQLLNARRFDQAALEFARFNKAGGVVVKGLTARRAAEYELWHSSATDEHVPSSVTRAVGMTPPTPATDKPLVQSKTIWAGGVTAAAGLAQGAQQVQSLVAPQAHNNELLQKLAGFVAVVIVIAGVLIVVFKALDQRRKTHQ